MRNVFVTAHLWRSYGTATQPRSNRLARKHRRTLEFKMRILLQILLDAGAFQNEEQVQAWITRVRGDNLIWWNARRNSTDFSVYHCLLVPLLLRHLRPQFIWHLNCVDFCIQNLKIFMISTRLLRKVFWDGRLTRNGIKQFWIKLMGFKPGKMIGKMTHEFLMELPKHPIMDSLPVYTLLREWYNRLVKFFSYQWEPLSEMQCVSFVQKLPLFPDIVNYGRKGESFRENSIRKHIRLARLLFVLLRTSIRHTYVITPDVAITLRATGQLLLINLHHPSVSLPKLDSAQGDFSSTPFTVPIKTNDFWLFRYFGYKDLPKHSDPSKLWDILRIANVNSIRGQVAVLLCRDVRRK